MLLLLRVGKEEVVGRAGQGARGAAGRAVWGAVILR